MPPLDVSKSRQMRAEHDERPRLDWTGERYVPELSGDIGLEHVHRYLLARELTANKQVLDIACGEGYGSDLLAQAAHRVVGVDVVPAIARHASRRYRRRNLSFAAGSCNAIPLADHSIDVVVSFETLEHHSRHEEMMREVTRVLRPGGLLVISSPDRRQYSDVPGYDNPFHVRELYHDEFDTLLRSHFQHVGLVGQRVKAGSIVGPLHQVSGVSFVSFDNGTRAYERTEGLNDALYLIGIATNGVLPALPVGVLDGGDFIWSADHHQVVHSAQERSGTEISQLAHAKTALDASIAALKAELERQVATIQALSVEKGRAEGRSAAFEEEVHRRGLHIQELEKRRALLESEADQARISLEDARAQLALKRTQIRLLETENKSLEQARASWCEREPVLLATIAQRESQLSVMESSHSWRLTFPIRAARRIIGQVLGLTRKVIPDPARRQPAAAVPSTSSSVEIASRVRTFRFGASGASEFAAEPDSRRAAGRVRGADEYSGSRHAHPCDCVLPPAVPPDPGKRSLVGQGIHRME